MIGRKKPYTTIGIKRLQCVRCGMPAISQWKICADGNVYRPICVTCDIALNRMVLLFMGFYDTEIKMARYVASKV